MSLGDHAIGLFGAVRGWRPPQGRAFPRYSLGAPSRFKSPSAAMVVG
jgi:hypothetical protein